MKELSIKEKELLLKDLCARLPYGVKCKVWFKEQKPQTMILKTGLPNSFGNFEFYNDKFCICSNTFKPYLRPMSSMTEEEKEELFQLMGNGTDIQRIDFYLSHYFDFRCLIPMGLALEATEEMYNLSK